METGSIDLSGRLVVIVEDQPVRALNLQIALEEAGAEAVVARGPQEARAQLQQFRFSVAIIDPGQRLLVRELEERKVPIAAKLASRSELFARLARAAQFFHTGGHEMGATSSTHAYRHER